MDINDLRGLSTVFMLVAFIGLVLWAYSGKRKQSFDEAANLPFADEDIPVRRTESSGLKGEENE
jgi:cytochrome c oxidase cbb3-type subunit 4